MTKEEMKNKAHRALTLSEKEWVVFASVRGVETFLTGYDVTSVHCLKYVVNFIHEVLRNIAIKSGKDTVIKYVDVIIGNLRQWQLELSDDEVQQQED